MPHPATLAETMDAYHAAIKRSLEPVPDHELDNILPEACALLARAAAVPARGYGDVELKLEAIARDRETGLCDEGKPCWRPCSWTCSASPAGPGAGGRRCGGGWSRRVDAQCLLAGLGRWRRDPEGCGDGWRGRAARAGCGVRGQVTCPLALSTLNTDRRAIRVPSNWRLDETVALLPKPDQETADNWGEVNLGAGHQE